MRVLVCVKRVPAPGARINLTADELAVDTTNLGFTTSPHEECAVEAAVQLVEAHGGEATVLTLGPPEAEEQLRYAVSVGMAAAVLLAIDGPDWDPQRTARAITSAVADLETRGRSVRPAAVRQRVGRCRRVPGRRPRRPRPRPADGQRGQGPRDRRRAGRRAAGDRRRCRALRAAAAGRRRRQGGHQPPPLPDDEGPAGVEEGGRSAASTVDAAEGWSAHACGSSVRSSGRRTRRSSVTAPTPRRPSSTCSSSWACCRDERARRRRPRPWRARPGVAGGADRGPPARPAGRRADDRRGRRRRPRTTLGRARRRHGPPGAPRPAR